MNGLINLYKDIRYNLIKLYKKNTFRYKVNYWSLHDFGQNQISN